MLRRFVVLLLLTLTPGYGLHAAQSNQPGIPAEVVALLAPMALPGLSAGGELRAGGPPAGFPAGLFPSDAIVNATLTVPGRNLTAVVVAAPTLSAEAFEKYEDRLLASGWILNGPRSRGFTMATGSGPNAINACRDSDSVALTSHARAAGGLYLRAMLTRDPRRTCVASSATAYMADINVPKLVPPAGARQIGGGSGSGGSETLSSTARLETTMAPRAVTEHYEKLLVGAGWKVLGRLRDGDDMAMVRFDVPSRVGDSVSAWLSATKLGVSGDQDIFLRVMRNTRDARMNSFPAVTSTISPVPAGR